MVNTAELKIIRLLLSISFSVSITLSVILAFVEEMKTWVVCASILVVILVACLLWAGRRAKANKRVAGLIVIVILNLFLIVPEQAVRLAGFRYETGISYVPEFTWWIHGDESFFRRFVPDEKLLWKFSTEDPNINSLGFRGREVIVPKPGHVYRILFLGDSCTWQGYPIVVEKYLNENMLAHPKEAECVMLAVPGYSSHQGRVLAEMYCDFLEPDLVVTFFGWNDHWLACGSPDHEKRVAIAKDSWSRFTLNAYTHIRTLQLLNWMIAGFTKEPPETKVVRVSEEKYEHNLDMIRMTFQQQGCPVIFITAPTAYYQLGVPSYIVEKGFSESAEIAIERHRRYNDVVREVTDSRGAYLLDMEAEFNKSEDVRPLFQSDYIHFAPPGLELLSNGLTQFIAQQFLKK